MPGAPAALCAKGFFNPAKRRGGGEATEAIFYSAIGPTLDVRMPPCVYAGVDETTGHGLVLMQDLVAAGATFLDGRSSYSCEQAAASLDQLAELHATTWGVLADDVPPALIARLPKLAALVDPARLQTLLDDGRAADLPERVRDAARVLDAIAALASTAEAGPACIVHGDLHTGNLYELADGSPGLIDWQVVQRGNWALDVAYHLAAVLDPDEAARSERSLLDHYRGGLAARGVEPPSPDDAWRAYRAHVAYGFFMWGITRQAERSVIEHLTTRLGEAVARHTSFDVLGV